MPWFSPGKLQQQRQEIGCDLVGLFVGKEVKADEGKALLLRSSACGAPDGSHGLEEPATTRVVFIGKVDLGDLRMHQFH